MNREHRDPHSHEQASIAGPADGAHAHEHAVPQSGSSGHDKHAGHSTTAFRDKFWISLLLTVPTLIWGHMLQDAVGYTAPAFTGSQRVPPVFGTAVFIYGGWVFLQVEVDQLKDVPLSELRDG